MISWHRALAGWLQRPLDAFLGVSTQGFLNTAGLEGNTKKLNQKVGGVAALGDLEAGWSGGSKLVLVQSDLEANLGYKETLLQNKVNKHQNSVSGHFVEKKTIPGHRCELLVLRMFE